MGPGRDIFKANTIESRIESNREDTQKTTVRSRVSHASGISQGAKSRRSIKSLRNSQRSNRGSDTQNRDIIVIGSNDTVNVNYSIDRKEKRVR